MLFTIVEGRFDEQIVVANVRSQSRLITYRIDQIDVPSLEQPVDGGNKGRVIELFRSRIPSRPSNLFGVVDLDFDRIVPVPPHPDGVLSTDYASMDAYIWTVADIVRFLERVCDCSLGPDDVSGLCEWSKRIFLLLAAKEERASDAGFPKVRRYFDDSASFDWDGFFDGLRSAPRLGGRYESVIERWNELTSIADQDHRNYLHGETFKIGLEMLVKVKKRGAFSKTAFDEQVRTYSLLKDLSEETLFSTLESSCASVAEE